MCRCCYECDLARVSSEGECINIIAVDSYIVCMSVCCVCVCVVCVLLQLFRCIHTLN